MPLYQLRYMLCCVVVSILLAGCVTGGGATVGVYADTRGDVGVAVQGHANLVGFRVGDTDNNQPAGVPLLGTELGAGFSFREDLWRLTTAIPIGAATWDDLDQEHGIRVSPAFLMDFGFRYDGDNVYEAFGGRLGSAYLRHMAMESEQYEGPDAIRIHRLGPLVSVAVMADAEGWFANFLVGIMYDFESYVASGK